MEIISDSKSLPCIVFCTTCKGRLQHLERTLPVNLSDNLDYVATKFVVLDYGSPDGLADYIVSQHADALNTGRLVYYQFPAAGVFRMAHAKNMAHRLGIFEGADILVNLDADNYTCPGFAKYIASKLNADSDAFLWARMVKDGAGRLPRGISGRIAVTRRAFLLSGGYDERFETWAPDDKDFNLRLQRLGFEALEIDQKFLHAIPHNDKMRFREYPHAQNEPEHTYTFDAVADSEATVVNNGRIGLGRIVQPVKHRAFTLQPLPTRIFGIGMHKTATTSLDLALQILGFDTAHWRSAHWAKAIWQEMRSDGKSLTLEKHYALSDLPITLLYRELDHAYPGSKFILTIRDEQQWLNSVRMHWNRSSNRFRSIWDHDPFTHKIHKALYGQRNFDADVFLARYRRHNAEVIDYFHTRPNDLLVMNMNNKGFEWLTLCDFLSVPIPEVDYPVQYKTRKLGESENAIDTSEL